MRCACLLEDVQARMVRLHDGAVLQRADLPVQLIANRLAATQSG
jgi:hypothetical protein